MLKQFLFCWENIPGQDENRLLNHLQKCLRVEGVAEGRFEKIEDGKVITVSFKDVQVILRLDDENSRVVLETPDGNIYEYSLIRREGKNLVYVKDLLFILREIDIGDEKGFKRLAKAIIEESSETPKRTAEIHHSEDEDDSGKATSIILEIGDLALTPLLESLKSEIPEQYVWDMKTVVNIQIENRLKIAKILEKMLDDKRLLQIPDIPIGVEESPPPRRVCDEAYLMLRHLLAFEEAEEEFLNSVMFLGMSDEEKDAEIERFKSTKRWVALSEQI
ncbi:hypothetical protein KEJ34_06920 [Candidatus Bathyarchaeota archaeon]|nr:hypothetical protein [Candidatus Bathyarchaeota archaeon]